MYSTYLNQKGDIMKSTQILIAIALLCIFSLITPSFSGSHVSFIPRKETLDTISPSVNEELSLAITSPRCSAPAYTALNETITIDFTVPFFDHVYFTLATAYESVVDTIELPLTHLTHDDCWTATVSIPLHTPPELYNLTVTIVHNGRLYAATEPRAVNVVSAFSDNISFIHITDFHVGDPRGFLESIQETLGFRSIIRCIDEINLLHPDFVVISGDLVFGQLYPREYAREYPWCYEMLQRFDVPTYLAPGNHDGYFRIGEDGLEFWDHYFGDRYYSFNIGPYHFQAINSFDMPKLLRFSVLFLALNWGGYITDEQLDWIEQDLDASESLATFLFMHHNPLWETTQDSLIRLPYKNRQELLDIIDDHEVDMVLAGHVHYDNVTTVNDTVFVTTTTPESEIRVDDGYWGYRLIEVTDGNITRYNYKEPKYSIPSYHLSATVINPYAITLNNELEQSLPILLEFFVPYGNYTVNQGEILLQRQQEFLQQVYVRLNSPAQSELTVTLTPQS